MQEQHKITFRTVIKVPAGKVWQALTDPALVEQYFFGSKQDTDWKVGSPIFFRGEWEGKTYEDKGIVLSFNPGRSLSYSYLSSWSGLPDVPGNYLRVGYTVAPVEGGTELTIEQTNYDAERAQHSRENWERVIEGMRKLVEE